VRGAVDAELTERQRQVFVALVLDGVPLDALAVELGSTRNALYKTLFDARRKLRTVLTADGYLDHDEPEHDVPGEMGMLLPLAVWSYSTVMVQVT
jgi:hypothetical protein